VQPDPVKVRVVIRLLDVIGPLSLATDLGNGRPLETALRCALLGADLARAHGFPPEDVGAAFWGGLLRFAGCTATSVEEASFGGDDLDFRRVMMSIDFGDPEDVTARVSRDLSRNDPEPERKRQREDFFARAPEVAPVAMTAHCQVAMRLASRLGMGAAVNESLAAYHERWDGGGLNELRGEAIPPSARVLSVAQAVLSATTAMSGGEARSVLERRAGGPLDPSIVATFLSRAPELLGTISGSSVWERAREYEPEPHRTVEPERLLELARVLGDYANVKSPYTLGHAQGVARVAVAAGRRARLDSAVLSSLETAALLHDLGRVSVPNGIWDRKGPLGAVERDRMRDHARYTEKILSFSPAFQSVAQLAASDHERMDASGYPRQASASSLPIASRILAAADVYHALLEERPHRAAHSPEDAARILDGEATARRLDTAAVKWVLDAMGHGTRQRRAWPAGLSDREVDVLRLLTRGLTNKEIGVALDISSRTVQQHTLNIYEKIGVSTRAAAALFASEHDLLAPPGP